MNEIGRFAFAIGASNPCHVDPVPARGAGYPHVVAPLSYYQVIRHDVQPARDLAELRPYGSFDDLDFPSNATRQLTGEDTAELFQRIHAGDRITVRKTLLALAEKHDRSGPFATATFELAMRNDDEKMLVRQIHVRVLR